LILRGARQVGKSTLVRRFAQAQSLHLAEVNLERNLQLDDVFATLRPEFILRELAAIAGVDLTAPGCLLFLDEVQETPNALPALRYLYEECSDLPVVAAGSLLEFTLSQR
jgi:predicted AAA+ superfamily ATPase